jgi:F-type H+-transporting ATPase subunit b
MAITGLLISSGRAVGAVVVDLDITMVGQVVLVLILFVALKPILFDRMLELFEAREKRIDGARALARRMDEASAGALSRYESEMQRARAAGNLVRDELRAEGVKEESEILGKVRASTTKMLDDGRAKLSDDAEKARQALRADSATLGAELAARVLGHEVQS